MPGGTKFITDKAYEIGQKLQEGNQKSKDLGLLLIHSSVLAIVKPTAFIKMVDEIAPVYESLNQFWNVEVFDKMGGVRGSGNFSTAETVKTKEKTGIDMESKLEGIDPQGFNNLQALIPFIGKIPPKTAEDFLVFKLFETILWSIFISTFKEDYIPKLTEIMSKPEFSPK